MEAVENVSGARIKVIGVGGAGGNAVNHMIESGITGVEFIAINTDVQDLEVSKTLPENRLVLGKGLGAGGKPEVSKEAAEKKREEIKEILKNTDMLFITAGMGGGTGTGAAPVIAEIAKELQILTVAIVTKPFMFEGPTRKKNSDLGTELLKSSVDSLISIPNDKLYELETNKKIGLREAFKEADNVLKIGIRGISDLITKKGYVNLDFADVKSIMSNSGIAMLGFGEARGEGRAKMATEQALNNPLLEKSIEGANKILLNITGGGDLTLQEATEIATMVTERTGKEDVNLIWGLVEEENQLPEDEKTVKVSIVATDFQDETKKIQNLVNNTNISSNAENQKEAGKLITEEVNKKPEYILPSFWDED